MPRVDGAFFALGLASAVAFFTLGLVALTTAFLVVAGFFALAFFLVGALPPSHASLTSAVDLSSPTNLPLLRARLGSSDGLFPFPKKSHSINYLD